MQKEESTLNTLANLLRDMASFGLDFSYYPPKRCYVAEKDGRVVIEIDAEMLLSDKGKDTLECLCRMNDNMVNLRRRLRKRGWCPVLEFDWKDFGELTWGNPGDGDLVLELEPEISRESSEQEATEAPGRLAEIERRLASLEAALHKDASEADS